MYYGLRLASWMEIELDINTLANLTVYTWIFILQNRKTHLLKLPCVYFNLTYFRGVCMSRFLAICYVWKPSSSGCSGRNTGLGPAF